ncbi:hypothetical protein MMC30_005329 [Trapelia coarctata]|nr:hypothetical protein [Trapelia coarctata]
MTISRNKFTPEVLITAPRRSPGAPSQTGSHALYTVSKYSLESHSETKEIRVLCLATGQDTLFSDDQRNKDPNWLIDTQVLWLREADGASTELWIGTAGEVDKNAYLAGSIPAQISNVKTKELSDGTIALAFTADSSEDGSLFNPEKALKPYSSAREYDTSLIRFWDSYLKPERSTLWYTTLQKSSAGGRYKLSTEDPINALKGTPLTCPNWPSDPFTGPGYDISTTGLLVNVRDPQFNPAEMLINSLWYIPLQTFTENPAPKLHEIKVPNYDGLTSSAVFSPSGKMAAFLKEKDGTKHSDWNHIFMIHNIADFDRISEISAVKNTTTKESWDLSPTSVIWSSDGHELYATAEDHGRGKLFRIPLFISRRMSQNTIPIPVSTDGVVTSVHPLSTLPSEKRLFINRTTLTDNSIFAVINPVTETQTLLSSLTSHGAALGLSPSQVSEVTFKSPSNHDIHAWVMKPSTFSPRNRYPLAFLIHGGPHSAWADAWSTRWNPAIFAEAGYIVVLPNPTGSTGFGHAFQSACNGDWGGAPYTDLEACFSHIEEHMSYVDTARAVALGGSYGGYMINWIAGQPLAKKFKALVCHDGIFSVYSMLATDVVAGLPEELGGSLTTKEGKEKWDRFDPAQHTEGWSTPMLVIHSDLDYRCPVTEGLAAFNVCQMRGIESKYLRFPDEGHFVLKRENSLRWYEVVLGWCDRFVGEEEEKVERQEGVVGSWKGEGGEVGRKGERDSGVVGGTGALTVANSLGY